VTEVPDGFVGKNAIVWTGDGVFEELVVQEVDGMLVTVSRDFVSNGAYRRMFIKNNSTLSQSL
jgi:hypothetical protein